MKKVQTKITTVILITTLIVLIVSSVLGGLVAKNSTRVAIEKSIVETAKVSALAAQNMISTYTSTINEIATASVLSSDRTSVDEKEKYLTEKAETYYMRSGNYADLSGKNLITGEDVSEEPFFQSAVQGSAYMSTPYIIDDKSDAYIVVSAPVFEGEKVTGVIYFACDTLLLQSIVESTVIGELGDAYILDQNGTTIAYNDYESVLNQENVIQQAKDNPEDKTLQALAKIEEKMISGKHDVDDYEYDDKKFIQSYIPIEGTDGWSLAVTISEDEFMSYASKGNLFQFFVALVILIIGFLFARRMGKSIGGPIVACTNRLVDLSRGDLRSPVPVVNTKDETAMLADSLDRLVKNFHAIIDDMSNTLGEIAHGNLTTSTDVRNYQGDFSSLHEYIQIIIENLNVTMSGIIRAANEVASSSEQVAESGVALSHGSVEQSGTVEQLSMSVSELAETIKNTAAGAERASDLSTSAGQKLMEGSEEMKNLVEAMQEIDQNSSEISKILKVIDDIAFQTNILALNAAVEAARAGEAGKGFAVVADEVRSLATKSAEAAKTTARLIENSVAATHKGTELVSVTSVTLEEVKERAEESNSHVGEISGKAQMQANEIAEINQRLEEISAVVQSNSATSEESAATSQELSRQAAIMKELVSKFRLKS